MLRWIEDLQADLRARGWSPVTIQGILESLVVFERWLGTDDPRRVTGSTVKDYLHYLSEEYRSARGQPLRYGTVSHRLLGLKIYLSFLVKRRRLLFDPLAALPPRPKRKALPDYVASEAEMAMLLDRPCLEEHHGIRDQALLELVYSAGLRRKEVLGLELGDVDLHERLVKIRHGKGDKERVVPFGQRAKAAVERYLAVTRPRWQRQSDLACPRFFLSERGGGLSPTMLSEILAKYRPHAKLHPHGLRHACALHMLRAGADIRYIQALLGHASPNTTMVYTRLFPADLVAMHDRYHPRERRRRDRAEAPRD